jgi:recombination DNA repair RAD52 pathway protein
MTNRESTTPITSAQLKALTGKLNPKRVANRAANGGGRRQLSYLQAWDVRVALIRVFGFGEWSEENIKTEVLSIERDIEKTKSDGSKYVTAFRVTVQCTVRLTIHQTGAVYTGVAAASQSGADIGEVTDFAIKTADSDAFKRAAMNLGTQFGLSLYDNGSTDDVVKVVLAPTQLHGVARTEANLAEAAAVGAAPSESAMTPEQQAQAEALVAKGLKMAEERDNARTPEDKATNVAEEPAPEEPVEEPAEASA